MDIAGFYQEVSQDIQELAAECATMDAQIYDEFKVKVLGECDVKAQLFMREVFSVIDKKRGGCRMLLKDINIYPCFWETPPAPDKMAEKRQYLKDHGMFQSDIVLDDDRYLLDGFTSYLLARECGLVDVLVRYGERQVIQAYHRPGGRLYTWELPERLTGQVAVGDEVVVHTRQGVRCVTVATVGRYIPQGGAGRMQMVIKRKGGPA